MLTTTERERKISSLYTIIGLVLLGFLSSCSVKDLYPIVPLESSTETSSDEDTNTSSETDTDTENDTTTASSTSTENGSDSNSETDTTSETATSDTDSGTETDTSTDTDTDTAVVTAKWVGCATQNRGFPYDFFDLWDQVTPENEGKWDAIELDDGIFSWNEYDDFLATAQSNGLIVKQHTFVWGQQVPFWMENLDANSGLHENRVGRWIYAFCQRYPRIPLINVVHNPLHSTPSYAQYLGTDIESDYPWVIWAFQQAKIQCPEATLLLNDFNVLRWQTDDFIALATELNDRGLLGGIGAAAHGLETMQNDELIANLDKLAAFDLPIYISEYDINIESDQEQLSILQNQFPIFYNHPKVEGITFWGYVEGATWYDNAYLRRADGTHRPALTWLLEYLGR